MTDPRRPGSEPRPLRPLLDEAPGAEPPAWLDANVRAAAAQAAELARQRGAGAAGEQTPDRAGAPSSDEGQRARLGWMPVGATVAVAVLGLMLVISRPPNREAASPQAESASPQAESTMPQAESAGVRDESARQKALDKAQSRSDAPSRERDAAASNEGGQPREAKRELGGASGAAAPAAPAAAAPGAAAPAAAAPASAPTAASPASRAAAASEVGAPSTAQACTERIGQLRRFDRVDDARSLLRACRSRFPEHPFPAEMVRALGD